MYKKSNIFDSLKVAKDILSNDIKNIKLCKNQVYIVHHFLPIMNYSNAFC